MTGVTICDLQVAIPTQVDGRPTWVRASREVSLAVAPGRVHALVGESGCGKSMLVSALTGLLPPGTTVTGSIRLGEEELVGASPRVLRAARGRRLGVVPQSAATYLTPTRTVGSQLRETIRELGGSGCAEDLLVLVHLAPHVLTLYPHELSGGMAQRVGLAFALAGEPEVILADEPTASLDRDLGREVLGLLRSSAEQGRAVLLITHDLASLLDSGVADDVSVMYAGRIVEHGPAESVLGDPQHDYTRALIRALPRSGLHAVGGTPPTLTGDGDEVSFSTRLEQPVAASTWWGGAR